MTWLESLIAEVVAVLRGGRNFSDPDEHDRPPVSAAVKLAIVVGHNSKAKGAFSKWIGSEWDFNKVVAEQIQRAAVGTKVDVKVFYRPAGVSYGAQMASVTDAVNEWGPDYAVSLHFNSFRTDAANGTETLWTGSTGSLALAEMLHTCQLDCFGLNNRGMKSVEKSGRGGAFLWGVKAPAVLLEPGFGSNKTDAVTIKKHWPEFAKDLIWAVQKLKS